MNAAQTTARQLAEVQGKATLLLCEVRANPALHARVEAWIARYTGGRKLSVYAADHSVPIKDKLLTFQNLVQILLTKEYTRLPDGPEIGQPTVATVAQPLAETKAAPQDDEEDAMPPSAFTPAQLAAIRREVRRELGAVLASIAKVLSE